jgi:hypothetical protein
MKGDNMSKALIYTANTAGAEVAIGNTVPVGSIIRRYGRCIDATGSAINLGEPGYYLVDFSATVTAAEAGNVALALTQNGVPVPGATAAVTIATATTQVENLSITALVRVMCCDTANLSVQVGGTSAPTIENMAFRTVKVV